MLMRTLHILFLVIFQCKEWDFLLLENLGARMGTGDYGHLTVHHAPMLLRQFFHRERFGTTDLRHLIKARGKCISGRQAMTPLDKLHLVRLRARITTTDFNKPGNLKVYMFKCIFCVKYHFKIMIGTHAQLFILDLTYIYNCVLTVACTCIVVFLQ